MEFAKEKVGGAAVETGVRLMVTIRLRLLDERAQEAILASCMDVLRASRFPFKGAWTSAPSLLPPLVCRPRKPVPIQALQLEDPAMGRCSCRHGSIWFLSYLYCSLAVVA
jgi:hypothetical protein